MRCVLLQNKEEAAKFLERFIFQKSDTDPTKMARFDDLSVEDIEGILDLETVIDEETQDYKYFTLEEVYIRALTESNLMKSDFPCVLVWKLENDWDRMGDRQYRIFNIWPLSHIGYDAVVAEHEADITVAKEQLALYDEVMAMRAAQQNG